MYRLISVSVAAVVSICTFSQTASAQQQPEPAQQPDSSATQPSSPATTQPVQTGEPTQPVPKPAVQTGEPTQPVPKPAPQPAHATAPVTSPLQHKPVGQLPEVQAPSLPAAADAAVDSQPASNSPVPAAAQPAAPSVEPAKVSGEQSFFDTRLNFTLTNENVFAKPGETIPSVPGWRFGVPNSLGTLFFDNYDTRFSGYETLSHAVLYKRVEKGPWNVEGALNIRINDLGQNEIRLSDAGSYLRVAYSLNEIYPLSDERHEVSFTAFPTSSDRFRLGYSYRLSWGGSDEYRRSDKAVPGLKIQYDRDKFYVFAGAKSAVVLNPKTAEEEAVLGFLGGGGVDVTEMVRVEANGGYFDRGNNELQDVIAEKVRLFGASLQVAIHKDEPIGSSIDYKLYRNDPERVGRLFRRAKYPGGLSWLVKAEITRLGQTLKDPEVSGGTTIQAGTAADINARVKYNRTRFRLDVSYRDLGFILHSTPSLPTFSEFPKEYTKGANFFAAVGADHNFVGTGLTLGGIVGIDKPATLETPTGGIPGDTVGGNNRSVAVIRNEGDITVLPQGEDAVVLFAAKGTARIDFAEYFAALVDVYFALDQNQTRLVRETENDLFRREFGEDRQLGFNLTLQAKF